MFSMSKPKGRNGKQNRTTRTPKENIMAFTKIVPVAKPATKHHKKHAPAKPVVKKVVKKVERKRPIGG
jgi:hypothetical protein